MVGTHTVHGKGLAVVSGFVIRCCCGSVYIPQRDSTNSKCCTMQRTYTSTSKVQLQEDRRGYTERTRHVVFLLTTCLAKECIR